MDEINLDMDIIPCFFFLVITFLTFSTRFRSFVFRVLSFSPRLLHLHLLCSLCPCWHPHLTSWTIRPCLYLLVHLFPETTTTMDTIVILVNYLQYPGSHWASHPVFTDQNSAAAWLSAVPLLAWLVKKRYCLQLCFNHDQLWTDVIHQRTKSPLCYCDMVVYEKW